MRQQNLNKAHVFDFVFFFSSYSRGIERMKRKKTHHDMWNSHKFTEQLILRLFDFGSIWWEMIFIPFALTFFGDSIEKIATHCRLSFSRFSSA